MAFPLLVAKEPYFSIEKQKTIAYVSFSDQKQSEKLGQPNKSAFQLKQEINCRKVEMKMSLGESLKRKEHSPALFSPGAVSSLYPPSNSVNK